MAERTPQDPRCKDCPEKRKRGFSRCADCLEAHSKREADRRAQLAEDGRCVVCADKAARVEREVLTVCPRHREYYRARDEQRRAS